MMETLIRCFMCKEYLALIFSKVIRELTPNKDRIQDFLKLQNLNCPKILDLTPTISYFPSSWSVEINNAEIAYMTMKKIPTVPRGLVNTSATCIEMWSSNN